MHNQTLLEIFDQIVHINESEILFTLTQLLAQLFLQVLHSEHVILDVVILVELLSLCKVAFKLKIKRPLVLLQVDLPSVKVFQFEVSDVVYLYERLEVLIQVVVILFAELLAREVGDLGHGFYQGGACARIDLLFMETDQVLHHHVPLTLGVVLAGR